MSESKKVSLRGSGAHKTGQKYQNKVAFHPNKNSKTDKRIKALPIYGLCARCTEQILWRKKFRKYKPRSTIGRCVKCQQKNVKEAYHVYCNSCATETGVCAKCLEKKDIVKTVEDMAADKDLHREQEEQMKLMTERERRSFLRRLEKKEQGLGNGNDVESESDDENEDENECEDESETESDDDNDGSIDDKEQDEESDDVGNETKGNEKNKNKSNTKEDLLYKIAAQKIKT